MWLDKKEHHVTDLLRGYAGSKSYDHAKTNDNVGREVIAPED